MNFGNSDTPKIDPYIETAGYVGGLEDGISMRKAIITLALPILVVGMCGCAHLFQIHEADNPIDEQKMIFVKKGVHIYSREPVTGAFRRFRETYGMESCQYMKLHDDWYGLWTKKGGPVFWVRRSDTMTPEEKEVAEKEKKQKEDLELEKKKTEEKEKKAKKDKEREIRCRNAKAQLEIVAWNWYTEYDFAIGEGLVKNRTGESLKSVEAVIILYTSAGEFITSDSALIKYRPLLPGQTSPFKVMVSLNAAMSKASIQFKSLIGPRISSCE